MSVAERIADAAGRLTAAERRVAQTVADDPKIVAFGTVAQLAAHSGTSGPTVLRFASKLGFTGFAELQAAVQEEISNQLPHGELVRYSVGRQHEPAHGRPAPQERSLKFLISDATGWRKLFPCRGPGHNDMEVTNR